MEKASAVQKGRHCDKRRDKEATVMLTAKYRSVRYIACCNSEDEKGRGTKRVQEHKGKLCLIELFYVFMLSSAFKRSSAIVCVCDDGGGGGVLSDITNTNSWPPKQQNSMP